MDDSPVIAEGLFSFQFGGSETVGVDLALEFQRRGYRVVCFAFQDSDGPMRRKLEERGIRCLDMNYRQYGGPLRRIQYYFAFWRMLRKEKIAALHVHHHGALILSGIPARLARIRRIVMTEHGLQALLERAEARRLAIRYGRYATSITAVEPGQIEYFHRELRFAASKLHCIPNGVQVIQRDLERARVKRVELGIPSDVFAFFYVGRLNPVKDLGTLLDAFALLPVGPISSRLYLVGEGAERAMLESKRETLGLKGRVELLGARTDVAEILLAADALVMSSKSEGLPMVLLEAMAAGVPCISTAVGGIPQLFGNNRGLLVPAQNPTALTEAMSELICSPKLRQELIVRAQEDVRRNYDLRLVADRYLELLGLPAKRAAAAI